MRHFSQTFLAAFVLGIVAGRSGVAQLLREADADRAPRFLYAQPRAKTPVVVDAATVPMLRRRISLDLQGVPRRDALAVIARESNLDLAFSDAIVPAGGQVRLVAAEITVAAALTDVLLDAGVDVVMSPNGSAVLIKRVAPRVPAVGSVTGRVTDAATGQPVAAVQVMVVGTAFGRTTDGTGAYTIGALPPGDVQLTARRVGYAPVTKSATVRDGATVTVDFALIPAPTQLTEVVTTVTGQQERYQIGNAISHLNADSLIREAPIMRLADVLMARVAGAQIVPNSGFSGESPRVRIRGISSIATAREPLLYVDGIRVDNTTGEIAHHVVGFLTYGHIPGRFNDIVPEDIESIEIVKGPSAATLYGTDAANGVIVVRTKRGDVGRPSWRVFSEAGMLEPAAEFQPSYYSWGHNTATGAAQRCLLVQQAAKTCTVDSLRSFSPLEDPETSMIGTGQRWQLGAQLTGGVDRFRYFFSAEQERERSYLEMPAGDVARISTERGGATVPDEQIHPNAMRKLNVRANMNTVFKNAEVALSSGLIQNYTRIPRGNEWSAAYWGPGYRDANNGYEASRGRPGESFSLLSAEDATRFINSVNVGWHPRDWLSTRATLGFDYSSMEYNGLQRRGEGAGATRATGTRLNMRTGLGLTTVDLGASAFTNLGTNITSRSSIGTQYNRRSEEVTFANATGLPPGSETVTGAATLTGGERTIESIVAGAYVEQTFGLRQRVFLTGAVRADGGSTFGRNFKTAVYPKASLSWLVSEEPFLPRIPGMTSVRLRAAFGAAGVQPGSTDALALVTPITSFVDGAATNGAVRGAIGNPDLRPERTREVEAGVDAEWFGKRMRVEATFYDKLSSDALIDRPLPTSIGLTTRRENLGSVRNRGWEGLVTAVILESKPITWDVTLNGSTNTNRLEKVNGNVTFPLSPSGALRVGYPLFSRWDPPVLSYDDANHNGIIEASEVVVADTAQYIGQSHPPRQLTIASGVSFFAERLRLSTQFDHRGGHVGMNFTELNRCTSFLVCRAVNDPSAPMWEQARVVAATRGARNWSGYMEDASFWRWRELALTYRVPESIASRIGGRTLSLTLAGRNLGLWTHYTSPDPEVNTSAGSLSTEGPSDNPIAPQTRYWTLRLNLGF